MRARAVYGTAVHSCFFSRQFSIILLGVPEVQRYFETALLVVPKKAFESLRATVSA